jgi:hypothetical protein
MKTWKEWFDLREETEAERQQRLSGEAAKNTK